MYPKDLKVKQQKEEEIYEMQPEFPCVIRRMQVQPGEVRIASWHWHKEIEMMILRKGRVKFCVLGQDVELQEGDGFFINSNILHDTTSVSSDMEVDFIVVMFKKEFLAGPLSLLEQKYINPILHNANIDFIALHPQQEIQIRILQSITQLERLERERTFGYEIKMQIMILQIWLDLLVLTKETPLKLQNISNKQELRVKSMLLFIQEHYMQELSVKMIAAAANISERECLRCFKEQMNNSPFKYLQELRLQIACGLLKDSKESITEISMKIGFSSASYFCKVFKEKLGMTPNEFRRKKKLPHE